MPLNEMRLNHVLCPKSLPTPIIHESLQTPIIQYRGPCVIKSRISGLHPIVILQNRFICFQTKRFLDVTLNDHLYSKLMCLFVGSEFLVLHRRLCTPRHFHGLSPLELCLTKNTGSFTRGGVYPHLLLPDTSFPLLFHLSVQLCWTSSNNTEPTQSNTKHIVDYNHTLTTIQCDVLVHMQCNVPFHVISCHMYD